MTRSERIEAALRHTLSHCTVTCEECDDAQAALSSEPEGGEERCRLVTCRTYRHGAMVGLLHVQDEECQDPIVQPAPSPKREEEGS